MLFDPPTKGDLTPKGCLRIGLMGVIVVLLLFGGWFALLGGPNGDCYDMVSGHAPQAALQQFIKRVIEAAAAQDYDWLATVSQPRALEALKTAQPIPREGYTAKLEDDLAGSYWYRVEFDSGLSLRIHLYSQWPEGPERDVTEQEILQYIRLEDVKSSRNRATGG